MPVKGRNLTLSPGSPLMKEDLRFVSGKEDREMKKGLATGLAAVLAMAMTVPAVAGDIGQGQRNRQKRISQGVCSR